MVWKKGKKVEENVDVIVEFIVEEYRFLKSYVSLMGKLMKDELPKYTSVYNFHINKINEIMEKKNLRIVDLVGKLYDDGLSVNPLNLEDFDKNDNLIIEQVLEPLIVSVTDGKIIKRGTVMLTRAKEESKEEE